MNKIFSCRSLMLLSYAALITSCISTSEYKELQNKYKEVVRINTYLTEIIGNSLPNYSEMLSTKNEAGYLSSLKEYLFKVNEKYELGISSSEISLTLILSKLDSKTWESKLQYEETINNYQRQMGRIIRDYRIKYR